jgi:hypothetical protein
MPHDLPSYSIAMFPFDKEWIIPDGKYLVRTISPFLKSIHYVQDRVTKVWNKEKQRLEMSIDVSRQTVTHISYEPLNFES